MKTAFIFPGQGSQYVGMGRDLYEMYPAARATFDEADEVLGFALSKLCFEGPKDVLTDTINTQPAILTVSTACLRVLQGDGRWTTGDRPSFVAGHSLGEYSALVAAEALEFAAALRLVRERGRLMKEAGKQAPGGMAAVIGLDEATLEEVCREAQKEGIVCIANYNSPGQTVISGERPALEKAMGLAKARGARRAIPLAVSIASHSPLLREAAEEFKQAVSLVDLREVRIPVIANVTARPISTVEEIKAELVQQFYSPLQWVRTIQYMLEQGVTTFVEIGPKDVLAGLIRRTDKSVRTIGVGDATGVRALAEV
ncbi:MAG: ACP S-malonyltransferase [Anaerolineae bacterium]